MQELLLIGIMIVAVGVVVIVQGVAIAIVPVRAMHVRTVVEVTLQLLLLQEQRLHVRLQRERVVAKGYSHCAEIQSRLDVLAYPVVDGDGVRRVRGDVRVVDVVRLQQTLRALVQQTEEVRSAVRMRVWGVGKGVWQKRRERRRGAMGG